MICPPRITNGVGNSSPSQTKSLRPKSSAVLEYHNADKKKRTDLSVRITRIPLRKWTGSSVRITRIPIKID